MIRTESLVETRTNYSAPQVPTRLISRSQFVCPTPPEASEILAWSAPEPLFFYRPLSFGKVSCNRSVLRSLT